MKKLLSVLIATLSIAPICATQYFGFDLGTNHSILTKDSHSGLKTGMSAGARYGYFFESGIRAEAQIIYRTNNYKTIYNFVEKDEVASKEYNKLHSWSYMLNLIYDVKQMTIFDIVPYLGLGVGYSANTENNSVKYNDHRIEDKLKDNRFAYQGIAGIRYSVQDNVITGIEYRYFTGHNHKKDHSVGMFIARMF